MTYDRSALANLGRQHKRARANVKDVRRRLLPEILAAHHDGVPQQEIVELTGYTREAVRLICLPDEQREALKDRRRKKTTP